MADSQHNVTININGNSSSAVGALNRVKTALGNVGKGIAFLSGALGKFNWAVHGIQMVVQAFKWLKEKVEESARAIAKIKWDSEMRSAATETDRLCKSHERLAKLLREELDTLAKQRALGDIEAQGKRDLEDGKREADRARQIYEAKTPEEEQALRDRFAAEDEHREREERKADRKRKIVQLDKEESIYASKSNGLKKTNTEIDAQIGDESFNLRRATTDEDKKAIQTRIDALKKRKEANEAEIAQFEKEAAFRREQIAALENQKDYEGPTAGEWQRKTEAKKRAEESAKAEAEAKASAEKEARSEAVRKAEREMRETNRENSERASNLEGLADRMTAADGVSQNRLTAMGLGAGASSAGGVASDVRKLVDLLRENVKATQNIKLDNGDVVALYGE